MTSLHNEIKLVYIMLMMCPKGKLAVFESSSISESGEAMLTKIGVHACDINPYLHEFFGLIPID